MGFWTLLEVASMPILQVLIISSLGAFMAFDYLNLLPADARKSLNKIVFMVFTPSLMFANLARTVTFQDIISWWFMVVNVGITFLIGGILGWIAVKLLRPKPHIGGLIISMCASDATIKEKSRSDKNWVIYKNDKWEMVVVPYKYINRNVSPSADECVAIWEGLKFAMDQGLDIANLESDCIIAVTTVRNPNAHATTRRSYKGSES
ncbi:Auxin efflux carrier family protein [Abeliophyllum distichum]|uniref:Auxin efflux carrier family protein n=1 Tax=Abeliophyllum distichum TaxID=126358 RepID=A0ABD1T0I2_9LAMI